MQQRFLVKIKAENIAVIHVPLATSPSGCSLVLTDVNGVTWQHRKTLQLLTCLQSHEPRMKHMKVE